LIALAAPTTTTTKTMEGKYFEVQHKVLKNSVHGQMTTVGAKGVESKFSKIELSLLRC
jgi:hypothetical protein